MMPTCIYCLEQKPLVEFNREHVIPEAFGTFGADTMVLRECVCQECNSHFGNTLDAALASDSWEALQRYLTGQKAVDDPKRLHFRNLQLRIDEGELQGAIARLRPDAQRGIVVDIVPQVGFMRQGRTDYHFVALDELSAGTIPTDTQRGLSAIWIIAPDQGTEQLAVSRLKELLPSFRVGEQHRPGSYPGDIAVECEGRIDSMRARAIAKIALNYVAYHSRQHRQLVLDRAFDRARRFVRYAEGEWREFVQPREKAILAGDMPSLVQTRGHLVTATLHIPPRGTCAMSCQVSLFNSIRYDVVLTRTYSGLVHTFQHGHLFDHSSKQISRLAPQALHSLPVPFSLRVPGA